MNNVNNILVVEDSDVQREVCIDRLKEFGFENIYSATNGIEALEVLRNNSIGLILSDWPKSRMTARIRPRTTPQTLKLTLMTLLPSTS